MAPGFTTVTKTRCSIYPPALPEPENLSARPTPESKTHKGQQHGELIMRGKAQGTEGDESGNKSEAWTLQPGLVVRLRYKHWKLILWEHFMRVWHRISELDGNDKMGVYRVPEGSWLVRILLFPIILSNRSTQTTLYFFSLTFPFTSLLDDTNKQF